MGNLDAEHQQLALDPHCGFPYSSDKGDHADHDRSLGAVPVFGTSSARKPLKPHMPPKNGLRLNHLGDAEEDGRSRVVHTSSARSPRQAWQGT
jgi:hypothetical protein